MIILGLDTSTERATVAISRGGEPLLEENVDAPREHMRILLPLIDSMLSRLKLDISDIQAISVGLGPGSFTGLRIGLSVAKGLVMGLGIPLVGISSLDAVAQGASGQGGLILVASDARRKEIYTTLYSDLAGRIKRLTDFEATSPDELAASVKRLSDKSPLIMTGDALKIYGGLFSSIPNVSFAPDDCWLPKAADLNRLASKRLSGGELEDPLTILPIYLRAAIFQEKPKNEA